MRIRGAKTDLEEAGLETELIAGKRQGNTVSALMKNFDIARESLNTAENESVGSANRELEAWNKGIESSFKHLQAQFEAFSNATLDSGFLKGIVDMGTQGLEVITNLIDKVGLLPMVLSGFGATSFFKNLDCSKIIGVFTLKSVYY